MSEQTHPEQGYSERRVIAAARAVDDFFDHWEWDDGDPPDCLGDLREAVEELEVRRS